MSADQITDARIATLRKMVEVGGRWNAWRRSDYLALCDALTASRAEVQALRKEVELTNKHEHQIMQERNEARAEVERLNALLAEQVEKVETLRRERDEARAILRDVSNFLQEKNVDAAARMADDIEERVHPYGTTPTPGAQV